MPAQKTENGRQFPRVQEAFWSSNPPSQEVAKHLATLDAYRCELEKDVNVTPQARANKMASEATNMDWCSDEEKKLVAQYGPDLSDGNNDVQPDGMVTKASLASKTEAFAFEAANICFHNIHHARQLCNLFSKKWGCSTA